MADVVMPRLSDSMEEGTILQWLKAVGDEIAVGDELVEIETDKANMAYEADVEGTLTEILVDEGETVAIGTPIARVGEGGDEQKAPHAQREPARSQKLVRAPEKAEQATAGPDRRPAPADGDGHRTKASPLARRIAEEQAARSEPASRVRARWPHRQG